MELSELQGVWSAYDKKLVENIQINKQILRQMLIVKPRRKVNWMQLKSGARLVFFVGTLVFLLSIIKLRKPDLELYSGIVLLAIVCIISFTGQLQHFMLLLKVDMSAPVLKIKENINRLKRNKIKNIRMQYILTPLSVIAVTMIFNTDWSSVAYNYIPLLVVVAVFFMKLAVQQWAVFRRLDELNKELKEIEELEK